MNEIPGLRYTSPNRFSFKQRLQLAVIPFTVSWALKAIFATSKIEERNVEHRNKTVEACGTSITAFWHESLGLAFGFKQGVNPHTLTSYSFDGELAARIVRHFGLLALRGSSSRGGIEALNSLVAAMEHADSVGFTLDGPRGPRRKAKPGIAILSLRSRVPVVPAAFAAAPTWRMKSWDRLSIPKPFSHIVCAYAPPIHPPENMTPESIESLRAEIETSLNKVQDRLDSELGMK